MTTWPLIFAAVERASAPIFTPVGNTRMPRPLTLAEFQPFSFLDNQKQKSEVLARATSSEQPQRVRQPANWEIGQAVRLETQLAFGYFEKAGTELCHDNEIRDSCSFAMPRKT